MATTEHFYTGNNSTTDYSFTFPYLLTTDIKVTLDTVATTAYSLPNSTTVRFNTAPGTGVDIHIYRDTDVDTPKATFAAGSSVRAVDLNNNEDQLLYGLQEDKGQLIKTTDIKDNAITAAKIVANAVGSAQIADNAVTSSELASDSVGSTQIKDNAVGSSEIASSAVGNTQIADNAVTAAKIAGNAVGSAQIADGAVGSSEIAADAVGAAQIADGAVGSAALAADSVGSAQIADGAVGSSEIAADAVGAAQIADGAVGSAALAADSVGSAQIADGAVGASEIAADAVRSAQIQDGAVGSSEIAADAVGTAQIADNAVTAAQIAADAVGTTQIADAELTTLAGMQSGTASILADSTALTSTTAELNLLDGKSIVTSVSGSSTDVQIPSAKAVNDQILSVTNALGGFVAIANETSFPATHPDPSDGAGTVVSISDAGGVVVNGSGVASITNGAGTGNTVTINGFPSSLYSKTLGAGIGLQVQTTTTLHTYDYHKILAKEADVEQLSGDINDFNERYRIASSAPGSDNDEGDLYFDTSTNKMMVYDGSSWGEVASTGSFYINTLSSSSGTPGTGGSATFNGSANQFTLSNPPTSAEQLLCSINGVVQKPNSGSSVPSEGFAISSNDIIFSSAPASGSEFFIVTIGASVSIGTPSSNTVSTSTIQNLAVNNDKIANDTIAEGKLDIHNAPSGTDKFLKYTSNGMEWVAVSSTPEGTAILSTGESGGTKFLREDGDNSCSWQTLPASGASLSGSTNNTVVTVTGANAIQGEATLTYDGTNLQQKQTGNTSTSLIFDSNRSAADNEIGGIVGKWDTETVADMRFFTDDDTTNKDNGYISFRTSTASGSLDETLRLKPNRDVQVTDGDLIIGTSGHGISFAANTDEGSTSQASILDDYEEGQWTPAWDNSVTSNSSVDLGSYIKVGNMVTVTAGIRIDSDNSNAALKCNNLPYTCIGPSVVAEEGSSHVGQVLVSGFDTEGGSGDAQIVNIGCVTWGMGTNDLTFYQVRDGTGMVTLKADSGNDVYFTITYRTI